MECDGRCVGSPGRVAAVESDANYPGATSKRTNEQEILCTARNLRKVVLLLALEASPSDGEDNFAVVGAVGIFSRSE